MPLTPIAVPLRRTVPFAAVVTMASGAKLMEVAFSIIVAEPLTIVVVTTVTSSDLIAVGRAVYQDGVPFAANSCEHVSFWLCRLVVGARQISDAGNTYRCDD